MLRSDLTLGQTKVTIVKSTDNSMIDFRDLGFGNNLQEISSCQTIVDLTLGPPSWSKRVAKVKEAEWALVKCMIGVYKLFEMVFRSLLRQVMYCLVT